MGLTATAQPSNVPPRVQLALSNVFDPTVTILRNDPDGRARPVRQAEPAAVQSLGTWSGYDYEAPFGQPLTYSVTADRMGLPMNDPDYEGGVVPAGAQGYFGATAAIVAGGYNGLGNGLATTTNSATNPQGLLHMASLGVSLAANTLVRSSAWVKAPVGTAMVVEGRVYQVNAQTWLAEGGGAVTFTATGSWQYVETAQWTYASGVFRPGVQVRLVTAATGVLITWDKVAVTTPGTLTATLGDSGNLIVDGDYEGTTSWVSGYSGVTPALVAGGVGGSAYSMGMTQTSTTNPQGIIHQAPLGTSVAAGTVVRIGVWVLATAGNTIAVNGNAYFPNTTTGSLGEVTGITFVADGTWQYVTADFTWAGAAFRPAVIVRQRNGTGHTVGHTIRIDQPTITVGTPAYTLNVSDVWLMHPGVPELSVKVSPQYVTDVEDRTRAARAAILQPLSRATPIVVSEARASVQSGLTVYTDTLAQRAAIWAAVEAGSPLLLNVPPALGWGFTWEYIAVGDVTEAFVAGANAARLFSLPYTVVDRPAGSIGDPWTYAGLLDKFLTYADVRKFNTYADALGNTL